MFKYKSPLAVALLLTISVTFTAPASAYASALDNLLAQTTNSSTTNTASSSSGTGVFDILIGLLLGKFIGNISSKSNDVSNVLGLNSSKTATETTVSGNALIDTGKKYMGVPYVWGGTTPDGFDCSGFTQYVMKQNGITIPRTAAEQFAAGTSVDKSKLKVGDLVFFTTYKPGASHVGFYMGNGQFLHASSAAQQVTTSSLDEQYYVDHYIGARRY